MPNLEWEKWILNRGVGVKISVSPASITYLPNIFQHKEGTWEHAQPWTVLWNGSWSSFLFLNERVKRNETIMRNHLLHSFHRSSKCFPRTVFLKVWSRSWNLSALQILMSVPRPFRSETWRRESINLLKSLPGMTLVHTRAWKLLLLRRQGWNRKEVIVQKR